MSLRKFKTVAALAGAALLLSSLGACSDEKTTETTAGETAAPADTLVGIAMPTRAEERWNKDGEQLQAGLEEAGYTVNMQFADNEVDQQISQLQNMINEGANILVIAAIEGKALAPILADAKEQGITVIAYDRLILDSPDVDYYTTFDNEGVGTLQGQYIEETLNLKDPESGPFNLEPFAGSPDDNNARFFFKGAWDILLPYVESGQLVVPSGKSPASVDDWTTIGIQGWEPEDAQNEMTNRLNSFYAAGEKLDVVLSPNDGLALGIAQALATANIKPGADYPILTGQDGNLENVVNVLAGVQSMTVFKDTRKLAEATIKMIQEIGSGAEVTVNNDTYDNGVKIIPTLLLDPELVTKDNVQATLVDSGFYTAEDLGL